MMKKGLLILLCLPMIGFGQNVYIPDANFKASLVGQPSINTNGDAEIQVSEATIFSGQIFYENQNCSDLTGIEAFTALTQLWCTANQLTSLDLSQNSALTALECWGNQLTNLNVNGATALETLGCADNQLTSLDVSNNTNLTGLNCGGNQITSLDLSNSTNLDVLYSQDNYLTSLSLNNINYYDLSDHFSADGNPGLICIEVSDSTVATNLLSNDIDSWAHFSEDCNYVTSIEEYTRTKELLKITDLLGRETKGTKNEVLFYIYDDETVEKKIIIE